MDMFDILMSKRLAGSGGTSDYSDLTNKPQINGHTLEGNQTAADLGLDQKQSDWSQSDTTAPDYIKNKPGITNTATQGSADLITSGGVYTIVGDINAALEEVL